jgi:hypothetical protein
MRNSRLLHLSCNYVAKVQIFIELCKFISNYFQIIFRFRPRRQTHPVVADLIANRWEAGCPS